MYYGYTDSLYFETNYCDALDKANLVGKDLCQVKNDYKTGDIFYGLLLAPKIKYFSTIIEFGTIAGQKNHSKDSMIVNDY